MPPFNLAATLSSYENTPNLGKAKNVLPKVVKRMTTPKGDHLVLTSISRDKIGNIKETELTLYKEIELAKGLKSYQKLEEKFVERIGKTIRLIQKNIFDEDGNKVANLYCSNNAFFSSSPKVKVSAKGEEVSGTFVSNLINIDVNNKGECINVETFRPEVKRFFKLLGERKLENLFCKKS